MRQATPTSDDLYVELRRRLPGWALGSLERSRRPVQSPIAGEGVGVLAGVIMGMEPAEGAQEGVGKDPIYGMMCDGMEDYYTWLEGLIGGCSIETARGEWLDLHAQGRGFARLAGEDDSELRARIRTAPRAATAAAIRMAVAAVVRPPDGAARIREIDLEAGTIDLGAGAVALDAGVIAMDGDGTVVALESLEVGDVVEIEAGPPQTVRRLVYVFTLRDRAAFCGGFWGAGYWGWPVLAREDGEDVPGPNARNVAVVVTPPQVLVYRSFWGAGYWGSEFWGAEVEDEVRYEAMQRIAEATRAAGVITLLWIQEA